MIMNRTNKVVTNIINNSKYYAVYWKISSRRLDDTYILIHFEGFSRDCSWDQCLDAHCTPFPRSQLQSSRELLFGGV